MGDFCNECIKLLLITQYLNNNVPPIGTINVIAKINTKYQFSYIHSLVPFVTNTNDNITAVTIIGLQIIANNNTS